MPGRASGKFRLFGAAARLLGRAARMLRSPLQERTFYVKARGAARVFRLSGWVQAGLLICALALLLWTFAASAIILVGAIAPDSQAAQAAKRQDFYNARINEISIERDRRVNEARLAQGRFYLALERISAQQTSLLESEERRKELEAGMAALQGSLKAAMKERDRARARYQRLLAEVESGQGLAGVETGYTREMEETVDFLSGALARASTGRDGALERAAASGLEAAELQKRLELGDERNRRIFTRLEEAVAVSLAPLERMFASAGVSTDKLIKDVRRGYTGTGGPLVPLPPFESAPHGDRLVTRANALLRELDNVNLFRIAAYSTPFALPLRDKYRFTSGFGPRDGRLHAGIDLAAPLNTPIVATADGIVTYAGRSGNYGRLVKIRHAMGFETRYAHLSQTTVQAGERVSRGDRIGLMGTSGRSTGVHLHYEVRVSGRAENPMKYIRAARNVF